MKRALVPYFVTPAVFVAIDLVWLSVTTGKRYQRVIGDMLIADFRLALERGPPRWAALALADLAWGTILPATADAIGCWIILCNARSKDAIRDVSR